MALKAWCKFTDQREKIDRIQFVEKLRLSQQMILLVKARIQHQSGTILLVRFEPIVKL